MTDPKYCVPRGPDKRFKPSYEKTTFQVNEMWEIHHEIVRRLVLGQRPVNIAKSLNVSVQMIAYVKNSPVVKNQIEIQRAARDADTVDISKRIRENAPTALKLLEDVIAGEVDGEKISVGMRAREAGNMLNRGGYAPITNIKGQVSHTHYDASDIEAIKEAAVAAGLKNGSIIEAKPEEVDNDSEDIKTLPRE